MHLLVVLLATTAILGQLISFPAPVLVVWRSALAAIGGALVLGVIFRRSLLPPVRRIIPLLGIGAIIGLHWLCFFGAIRLANISICLAGLATISFFTAFTEPWLERRPVRPVEVALGLLVLFGILTIAGFESGRIGGLLLALLGALLAAVFPVLNRRLVAHHRLDPLLMIVWEMVGASVVCLAILPVLEGPAAFGKLFDFHGWDWFWLLILSWVCTVFAHTFQIHLLRYLSAYTSNLAFNFEPIYGILAAALLFGEHRQLHPGFFIGAVTIFIANLLYPVLVQRLSVSSTSPGLR